MSNDPQLLATDAKVKFHFAETEADILGAVNVMLKARGVQVLSREEWRKKTQINPDNCNNRIVQTT